MFVSCLTGIWLWWPLGGSFASVSGGSGATAERQPPLHDRVLDPDPLAMLSFTGAWISFPKVFGAFESGPPSGPDRGAQIARRR